ncbi:MAG: putative 2OG-Fe(II) oxygenase [Pseudomonadota bacterium]
MDLVDIFPATIGVTDLKSLTPALMASARALIDADCSGNPVAGDGSFTREQQLLNRDLFAPVKQEILGLCRDFSTAHSHQIDDLAICNSWGNVVRQGENIRYHQHNNAYISGSFYLSDGSPFNILNQHHGNLFNFAPAKVPGPNYRAMDSFTINPKPGRLVLFPANLMHCVLPSQSIALRYSIAFNVIPLGKIGTATSLMEIRLG